MLGCSIDIWRSAGIPDWLLWYTEAGACRIGCAGEELVSQAGEVILIAPRTPHDYGPLPGKRWDVSWAVFQPRRDILPLLSWPVAAPGVRRLALTDARVRSAVIARLNDISMLSISRMPSCDDLLIDAITSALRWCRAALPVERALDPRLQRAVDLLCERLDRPIGITAAARVAGVSRPQLARLFRRHLGTSPRAYLEDRRLERGLALIRATALPMQEIALQCGFTDAFYFSTRFRRRFGRPPSALRET